MNILMNSLIELLSNKIVICCAITFLIVNLLKIFFNYLQTKKIEWKLFLMTGGMPSSHTSFVTCVTTSLFFLEGISNVFILSLALTIIVIPHSIGLRRAVGKQAMLINQLIDEVMKKKFKPQRLYELLGHTPSQTFVGFIFGIVIPNIMFLLVFQ